MKTIEVLIAPNGQATVKTQGFAGSGCREGSQFLEQALGLRVSEALTAEFHQGAAQAVPQPLSAR